MSSLSGHDFIFIAAQSLKRQIVDRVFAAGMLQGHVCSHEVLQNAHQDLASPPSAVLLDRRQDHLRPSLHRPPHLRSRGKPAS
mmetsp:Transcript_110292/g.297006  ORF Transcript_110292/g.297006 Transcript_110292/m.297006 type:complete len:83 (+) Transcript_110292:221-469(+)